MDKDRDQFRIGIITFDWATNYGAVLQAFALQTYLEKYGAVRIIPFVPARMRLYEIARSLVHGDWTWFLKERHISSFRHERLKPLRQKFYHAKALDALTARFDVFVAGSDQVWNETVVLTAEARPVLSYYLDFVSPARRRIAYAVSFGADELSAEAQRAVMPEIAKFDHISVRESSAVAILERMGKAATLVVDPTVLLGAPPFGLLADSCRLRVHYEYFVYIINVADPLAASIAGYIERSLELTTTSPVYRGQAVGVSEWLEGIRSSRYLVSNSFHAIVFALLFHTDFVAVAIPNSRMNDRIRTLLALVGLENRYFENADQVESGLDRAMAHKIDWLEVDKRLNAARIRSSEFLDHAMSENSDELSVS